jgi:hypothetical protein
MEEKKNHRYGNTSTAMNIHFGTALIAVKHLNSVPPLTLVHKKIYIVTSIIERRHTYAGNNG